MDTWNETLNCLFVSETADFDSVKLPENVDFVDVVESLQKFMTHSDPLIRTKASKIFKTIFVDNFGRLDEASVELIKKFLVSKLEDGASVVESIDLLNFLMDAGRLNVNDELFLVVSRALESIKAARLAVENRLAIFKFVSSALNSHFVQFSDPKSAVEFLEIFLNAIQNEKDPRILLLVFNLVPKLLELPADDYIEEIFEAVYCYFPITFRTNPSDPTALTVEDLKGALREALAKGRKFGDLAVPLLVEKLSSNSMAAKLDSLQVINQAIDNYDPESFIQFLYQLEVAVFSEIIGNADTKIQAEALNCVRLLARRLSCSNELEFWKKWINKFMNEAIKSVELESMQVISKAAVSIEAVSSADKGSFDEAVKMALKSLMSIALARNSQAKTLAARNALVALLSPLKGNPEWAASLYENREAIESLFQQTLTTDQYASSINVFLVLFSFTLIDSELLSDEFTCSIVTSLVQVLNGNSIMINFDVKNCLWLCAKARPSIFTDFPSQIQSVELIGAIAASSNLSKIAIVELFKKKHESEALKVIEDILLKSELDEIVLDIDLIVQLLGLCISDSAKIQLLSKCSEAVKKNLFELRVELSLVVLTATAATLKEHDQLLKDEISVLTAPAVFSLFNKCPEQWKASLSSIKIESDEKYIAALRGLIYRCDSDIVLFLNDEASPLALAETCHLIKLLDEVLEDKMLKATGHVKKPLYGQWFLSLLLKSNISKDQSNREMFLTLIAVAAKSLPMGVLRVFEDEIVPLLLSFAEIKTRDVDDLDHVPFEVLVKFVEEKGGCIALIKSLDSAVRAALNHVNFNLTPNSQTRFWALEFLAKLVIIEAYRSECLKWKERVVKELRIPLDDPKRAVRSIAAKCRNLWYVIDEPISFTD